MWLALLIYLIDVVANDGDPAKYGAGGLVVFFVIFFFWTDGYNNTEKATLAEANGYRIFKAFKPYVFTVCTIAIIAGLLIPNKETSYKMLAAYGTVELVTNETVQKYAGGSLQVLDKAMTEYLGEGWDKTEKALEAVTETLKD